MSAAGYGAQRRIAWRPAILGLALCLLAYYPFASQTGRQVLYLAFAWAVIIAVGAGLRRSAPPMRTSWRLVMVVMVLGAIVATAREIPALQPFIAVPAAIVDAVSALLLLVAALIVVVRRGRHDYAGVIDATLAAVTLGGLLLSLVLLPTMAGGGDAMSAQISLALVVLVLSGTLGAIVRLMETDPYRLSALRWLLVALTLNLGGFTLAGTGADTAARMMFMGAFVALGIVGFDPDMARLADPAPAPREKIGPQRLALLGVALVAVPVAEGFRALLGDPVDGLMLALSAVIVAPLVMLRIGLLSAASARSERELLRLATRDPLTGALNRRAFLDQAGAVLQTRESCVLVFCDLNGFKQINDSLGHLAGDRLLAEVGRRLNACAGENDLVCRYGGDEFVLLLRNAGREDVQLIAGRIRSALAAPLPGHGGHPIGVSIGAAVSDGDRLCAEELIHMADKAMYSAKPQTRPGRLALS